MAENPGVALLLKASILSHGCRPLSALCQAPQMSGAGLSEPAPLQGSWEEKKNVMPILSPFQTPDCYWYMADSLCPHQEWAGSNSAHRPLWRNAVETVAGLLSLLFPLVMERTTHELVVD